MNTTRLEKYWPSFGAQLFASVPYALLLLIFVTGSSSAQTQTALNGPGNVFSTAKVLGTGGSGPTAVAVADFNGDGHADVVVANGGNTTIGVLLGNGDGTFHSPVATTLACNPSWVITGDFNGDGKPDVAVIGAPCGNPVEVLLGNGDGTFTSKSSFPLTAAQSVVAGDFNGDGKLDLAVVVQGSPDTVNILLGNGDGTFQPPISASLGGSVGAYQAVAADFNKDGHLDLAISEKNGSAFLVLLGNGDGTFQAASSFTLPAQGYGIAAADFNGDGIPDIVATSPADGGVSIFLGDGKGHFTPENNPVTGTLPTATASLPAFAGPTSVAVGDFNNDGKPDVIAVLPGAGGSSGVAVLLGIGNGTLAQQLLFGAADTAVFVAVGDFNNDGKLDWVAATNDPVDSVSVALGRGDGTFQAARIYTADNAPAWFAFADFNSDAVLDMLVTNQPANTIDLLLGNKDGTFQTATGVPFAGVPGVVVTGDFNNDGKQDFVVRNDSGDPYTVAVYLGNGDGAFQAPKSFSTGGVNGSLMVAGDFNGDGRLDLAVSNNDSSSPSIAILLGNGDGTFGPPIVTSAGGASLSWLAAADLNKDGHLDLIAVDNTNQDIAIFLGKGDGTFQAPITIAQTSPVIAAVGDFNNDGNPDLLVTGNGNANLYLGKGDGTFDSPLTVSLATLNGQPALWVAVADFNLDGNLDFVVGANPPRGQNFLYQGIRLLLGKGDGTFQPEQDYLAGNGNVLLPTSVGDFNGDGAPDLAVIDFENSILVLLNQTAPPIAVLPSSLSFGNQLVGTTSATQLITVTNNGVGATTVGVAVSGDFSQTNTCPLGPATLAVGANCTINAAFTPTAMGTRNGAITVTHQLAGSPATVTLTGTGVAPIVMLGGTSISFGNQPVGSSSTVQMVSLSNTGTAALTISSIDVTGTNSGDFSQTNTCGASVAAGASCSISVTFTPTATGARTASVSISDSAAGSPQSVSLSGTGTGGSPDFSFSASPGSATVTAGSTATYNLTVTAANGFSQPVTFACTGLPSLSACSESPASVTPSGSAATSTLSISTTATTTTTSFIPRLPRGPAAPSTLALAAFCVCLLSLTRARRRGSRLPSMLAAIVILGVLTGCSGGGGHQTITSPGTPAGTYTVTVTAASGSGNSVLSHSTTVTLIVQ